MEKPVYHVIGLMSGTSLDGLDIAFCTFEYEHDRWSYTISHAETIPHTQEWKERLTHVMKGNALDLAAIDTDFGRYSGTLVNEFIHRHSLNPGFIASHGHTIFHQPEKGITLQIGKGQTIAAITGLPVVFDFRTLDVALGGQGAPLVPVGDRLLFGEFGYCLNIGGIANISCDRNGKRIAFDVSPANMVLNRLANREGLDFDADGELARQGTILPDLLDRFNRLDYYAAPPPKSLGREWVEKNIFPLTDDRALATSDLLATFCEHIAIQVSKAAAGGNDPTMLITGGGALNSYLTARIGFHSSCKVVIPDQQTVNFKEALVFAFLGVLRMRGEINTLASVTGARHDSSGGVVVQPNLPIH